MLKEADLGIDSLSISEVESQPVSSRFRLSSEILTQWRTLVGTELTVQTGHYVADADTEEQFDMTRDESNGTQRLFALAAPLIDALEFGHTLVVDEFECSIHSLMSRRLVEQFQQGNTGPRYGQLVFATQDVLLMDKELLRRDQIWLVEKNAHAASDLYSLYDIRGSDKPRNNEALQRNYLAGRYGGIPRLWGDVLPAEPHASESAPTGRPTEDD
jgi:AAA15 family ATPase/GTPase